MRGWVGGVGVGVVGVRYAIDSINMQNDSVRIE